MRVTGDYPITSVDIKTMPYPGLSDGYAGADNGHDDKVERT